jgi:hypothetical protein
MNCDNGTFRLGLSISPLRSPNTELQFSLLDISDRIDMVRYEMGDEGEVGYQWLEVNAENKEQPWKLFTWCETKPPRH